MDDVRYGRDWVERLDKLRNMAAVVGLVIGFDTGGLFGDLGSPNFGATFTDATLDQQYGTFGASAAKTFGRHTLKFGYDFERTQVDGVEASAQQDQLFATQADFEQFGPIDAGFFLLFNSGGFDTSG